MVEPERWTSKVQALNDSDKSGRLGAGQEGLSSPLPGCVRGAGKKGPPRGSLPKMMLVMLSIRALMWKWCRGKS